ncbi:DUF4214 domain-containing protein [Massilia sp. YIM B04103]|uniref:DUF4214 domain-containing protein n=1 Tax=Massilia sp. YIM B04103 TaxID=2963106 RepID=UPI002109F2CB
MKNAYDQAGRLWQSTDANGTVTEFTYDAANRILSKTIDANGPLKLSTKYSYDALGQVQTVTDPRGIETRNVYDKKGQLKSVIVDNNGAKLETKFEYDGRGKTLSVTDPAGRVTVYEYDNLGRRIAEVLDPKPRNPQGMDLRTEYEYDGNGNVISRKDANGAITRFSYDANQRLSAKIDGAGAVTRYEFDAAGHVTRTTSHATALKLDELMAKLPQPRSTASDIAWLLQQVKSDAVKDRVTYLIYDKDGRLKLQIDGAGGVTRLVSDGNGNVIERQSYAKAISTAQLGATPSEADIVLQESAADRRLINIYDAANRLTATATVVSKDGGSTQWALVQNEYDSNGNLIGRRALATAYGKNSPLAPSAKEIDDFAQQNRSDRDAAQRYAYDNANRQISVAKALGADANGVVQWAATAQDYDRAGNLVTRTEFTSALSAAKLPANADAKAYRAWLLSASESENDRITRFGYDGANRQTISVDAMGAITRLQLDGSGNVVKRFSYADVPTGYSRKAAAEEILALKKDNPGSDRIEHKQYDAGNRLRFTQDSLGYIKQLRYDAMGRVLDSIEYRDFAAMTDDIGAAAKAKENTNPRITSYTYDANGNVLSLTDAMNAKESYVYDALGNKTSFTNKLGKTWLYAYDNMGRLKLETTPEVLAYDSNGLLLSKYDLGHPTMQSLKTQLEYDALGNLLFRREGYESPVMRQTEYRYDAAGHQIQIIRPSTRIYDAAADQQQGFKSLDVTEKDSGSLISTVSYDVLGNAVANKDVGGEMSYKLYDAAGRVRYEVDAKGYVTAYERDAFGAVVLMTRYANPVAVPNTRLASLSPAELARQLSPDSAQDRTLETRYDRLGRVQQTLEPTRFIYDPAALGSPYLTAAKTTVLEYTAFGEIRKRSVYGSDQGRAVTEAAVTLYYFNKRGEKSAEVAVLSDKPGDRRGYLTTYRYDFAGNLESQTEYSGAYGGWREDGYEPFTADSPKDRRTAYTYDDLNRRRSETKANVTVAKNNGDADSTLVNLKTEYTYDAVGNQRSITDALQGQTFYYYDALGRQSAIVKTLKPGASDIVNGGDLLTEFARDLHGNTVLTIEYADGPKAGSVSEQTYLATSATNERNRMTANRYDANGLLVETMDAVQFMGQRGSTHISYDVYGRVAKSWRAVSNGDKKESSYEITRYDTLGRISEVLTPGNQNIVNNTGAPYTRKTSSYNAFGDVTSTGYAIGDGAATEISYAKYDRAGNAWLSNGKDGIDKVAFYDAFGQATAVFQSTSTDASILSRLQRPEDVLSLEKLVRTNTRYDRLGHVVDRRQAGDPRLMVLQLVDGKWLRLPLAAGESAKDSLLVLGDSSMIGEGKSLFMHYRAAGNPDWIMAEFPRLQVVDGNPVFNTRGMAPGQYEYKVFTQVAGQPLINREGGTMTLAADPAVDPTREIVMLYMLVFGRAPDIDGLRFWLGAYGKGYRRDEILQHMLVSVEAQGRFKDMNAAKVIETIYQSAFNYSSAQLIEKQGEIGNWVSRYVRATSPADQRGTVLADLLGSTLAKRDATSQLVEIRALTLSNFIQNGGSDPAVARELMAAAALRPATVANEAIQRGRLEGSQVQLIRLYLSIFGRAPDKGGFDAWLKVMLDGVKAEAVAEEMLRSPEAMQPWMQPVAGLTAEQYREQLITRAYDNMLGRKVSADELSSWTAKMSGSTGLTRGQFIVQLAGTIAEYRGNDAARINDRTTLSNKLALAYTASVTLGGNLDSDAAAALLKDVKVGSDVSEAVKQAIQDMTVKAAATKQALQAATTAAGSAVMENQWRTLTRMYFMFTQRPIDNSGLSFYLKFYQDYLKTDPKELNGWTQTAMFLMTDQKEPKDVLGNWQALSNDDFVALMYRNALGYAPNSPGIAAEMATFSQDLRNGKSRFEVAASIAMYMLSSPQMQRSDQPHRAMLDNRTTMALAMTQVLDLSDKTVRQEVMQKVSATDLTAATDYAYAAYLNVLQSRLVTTQNAARSGLSVTQLMDLASKATLDANSLNNLPKESVAFRRLQLTQLYVALLQRGGANPIDAKGLEFHLSNAGALSLEQSAQFLVTSKEWNDLHPPLGDRAFVETVCKGFVSSLSGIPEAKLQEWTNMAGAGGSTPRGNAVAGILRYIMEYSEFQPKDANSLSLMQARAGFLQKVANAFVVLDNETKGIVQQQQQDLASKKAELDQLTKTLRELEEAKRNLEAQAKPAIDRAQEAIAAASTANGKKVAGKLGALQLYVLLNNRSDSRLVEPWEVILFDSPSNTISLAKAAEFILNDNEAKTTGGFPATDSPQQFAEKIYNRLFGRSPTPEELAKALAQLGTGTNFELRGQLVAELLERQNRFEETSIRGMEYKKAFDTQVASLMDRLVRRQEGIIRDKNAELQNLIQNGRNIDEAISASQQRLNTAYSEINSLGSKVADARWLLASPDALSKAAKIYAALRDKVTFGEIIFHAQHFANRDEVTHTKDMIAAILQDDKYPSDNSAFVDTAYQAIFKRHAEPNNFYVGRLNAGKTNKVDVVYALIGDTEGIRNWSNEKSIIENSMRQEARDYIDRYNAAQYTVSNEPANIERLRQGKARNEISVNEKYAEINDSNAHLNTFNVANKASQDILNANKVQTDVVSTKVKFAETQAKLKPAQDAFDELKKYAARFQASADAGSDIQKATSAIAAATAKQAATASQNFTNADALAAQRIVHVYLGVLNKGPSVSELQYWLEQAKIGSIGLDKALLRLADSLMAGPEAQKRNLFPAGMSNLDFVKQIYINGLDRSDFAGDTGPAAWANLLQNGASRAQLVLNITEGALKSFTSDGLKLNNKTSVILEKLANAKVADEDAKAPLTLAINEVNNTAAKADAAGQQQLNGSPAAQLVVRIVQSYLILFKRQPDPFGMRFYFQNMSAANRTDQAFLLEHLLKSDEAAALYPPTMTNEDLIHQLFRNAMNRSATPDELAKYMGQLQQDKRENVIVKIINDMLQPKPKDLAQHISRSAFADKIAAALSKTQFDFENYGKSLQSAIDLAQKALANGVNTPSVPMTPVIGTSISGSRVEFGSDQYKVDRWGNVLEAADLRDSTYKISYSYDHNNQLLAKSHNAISPSSPPGVQNRYDAVGRLVATRDANGNVNKMAYNSNGYQIAETHADGGEVIYEVDKFGLRTSVKTSRAPKEYVKTTYVYDQLGRQLSSTSDEVRMYFWDGLSTSANGLMGRQLEVYAYDELGRRISAVKTALPNDQANFGQKFIDPNMNATTRLRYDLSGNVIETTDAAGRSTQFVYDALNRKIAERGPNLRGKTWAYDAQGRLQNHTDLDGNLTTYKYNASNQLVSAKGEYKNEFGGFDKQELKYSYEDHTGQLSQIEDTNLGQTSSYTYDALGNRISEKVKTKNGAYIQNQILHYDWQNRLEAVNATLQDSHYQITYKYDLNGNKTGEKTIFNTTLDTKKTITVAYKYDNMNRQTQVSGNIEVIQGTQSRPTEIQSKDKFYKWNEEEVALPWENATNTLIATHDFEYDQQGNRTRDNQENYSYDALGRLSTIMVGNTITGSRQYDTAGRVIASNGGGEIRLNAYDISGRLEKQRVVDGNNYTTRSDITYRYFINGELEIYALYNGAGDLLQTTNNDYKLAREGYLLAGTTVRNYGTNTDSKTSVLSYDVNGNLSSTIVANVIRNFTNDSNGHVLEKVELKSGVATSVSRTLIVNGEVRGSNDSNYETFSSVYESLTGSSATEANPSTYVVQKDGETLASVAKAVWGNERLWYLIAQANGLNGSETLKAGQPLTIPQKASAIYNDATTFKPYDAAELVGNTTPELALPPPPSKGKKCGGLGQIIMIVVAVIVTIYTAGAAASLIASGGATIGGSMAATFTAGLGVIGGGAFTAGTAMAAGAIGAAAGSIASQGFGMAVGIQDKFSWRGVATAAIGGGISAGVANMAATAQAGSVAAMFQGDGAAAVGRAVLSNVASQGINTLTGLQQSFDWRGVVASAAGAGAGQLMGKALAGDNMLAKLMAGNKLAQSTTIGFAAGATAAIARGGKVDVARIATDAFGNALASSMAEQMRGSSSSLTEAQTEAMKRGFGPLTDEAAKSKIMGLQINEPALLGGVSDGIADAQNPAPGARPKSVMRSIPELKVLDGALPSFDKSPLANFSFLNDIRYKQSYESGTESRVLGEPQDFDPIRRTTSLGKVEDLQYRFRGGAADVDARSQEVQIGSNVVNVIYPKNPTVGTPGFVTPSLDRVVKALGLVEDVQLSELRTVVLNSNQNPSDAYWAREYNRPDFRSAASAGAGVVNFYPSIPYGSDQSVVDATIIHEVGHLWSAKLWQSEPVKQAWVAAMTADSRTPSSYATAAATEDFSEALVMYRMSKGTSKYEPVARQLFPARYGILDNLHVPVAPRTK